VLISRCPNFSWRACSLPPQFKLRVILEYREKLGKAGVGFVSIMNQLDYSRPEGKFILVFLGGLAEM